MLFAVEYLISFVAFLVLDDHLILVEISRRRKNLLKRKRKIAKTQKRKLINIKKIKKEEICIPCFIPQRIRTNIEVKIHLKYETFIFITDPLHHLDAFSTYRILEASQLLSRNQICKTVAPV